ncbi:hypothetical protein FVE85_2050 [Porphyridium purpureum]|uniref:Uncharacterized protein n=1 Tax=Porphyridium purpureum TaxID=35688 RepID=A0A5J4YXM0_PORPP|nr:hypothetical protein FVE85_2050 [Porphyridium purpureum]|eukprot:POR6207..scf209_3
MGTVQFHGAELCPRLTEMAVRTWVWLVVVVVRHVCWLRMRMRDHVLLTRWLPVIAVCNVASVVVLALETAPNAGMRMDSHLRVLVRVMLAVCALLQLVSFVCYLNSASGARKTASTGSSGPGGMTAPLARSSSPPHAFLSAAIGPQQTAFALAQGLQLASLAVVCLLGVLVGMHSDAWSHGYGSVARVPASALLASMCCDSASVEALAAILVDGGSEMEPFATGPLHDHIDDAFGGFDVGFREYDLLIRFRESSGQDQEEIRRHGATVDVVPARDAGTSCHEVCAREGKVCSEDGFEYIDDCKTISSVLPCKYCTTSAEHSEPIYPAMLVYHANSNDSVIPVYVHRVCLRAQSLEGMNRCDAGHPGLRRLCPCQERQST